VTLEPISKKWIWFIFPINIAAEGLHTAIPLFVIRLGGGISEVALITAMHYGVAALGSIFWGKILDRYHAKKAVLVISFSIVALCSVWLFFIGKIEPIYAISPIAGFFLVARSQVTQMLVMETIPNNQWSRLFARTSILATMGSLAAMVLGVVWSLYFDGRQYFLVCAISTCIALGISLKITKTSFHIERHTIAHSIHGIHDTFGHFRLHHHFVFPKVPALHDYKHILTILKGKVSHEIGFLFLTNLLFYFGSNIYFTALTPFLKNLGLSDSVVFLLYLTQTCTMIGIFFAAPKIISKTGEERATILAYVPRILGMLVAGFLVAIFSGMSTIIFAAASMILMVVGFSLYSTASSVILFKSIPKGFEGTYLGVNSSMVGLGVFVGALTAGFVTRVYDYQATFLGAAVILVLSLVLFWFYLRHKLSEKTIHH
jgi:MFS family permease